MDSRASPRFLPVLTLEGIEGKLFRPIALTMIFALLGSLVLSLTLMPVLASLLLPRRMKHTDPWLVHLARRVYEPILDAALKFRTFTIVGPVAIVIGALFLASRKGG